MRSALKSFSSSAPLRFLFLVFLYFLATSAAGADFGYHWDEGQFVRSVSATRQTGSLFPESYNYPSFSYWLYLVSSFLIPGGCDGPAYLVGVRLIFILFSSLTILWTYRLSLEWQKNRWEALMAASLAGLSWEMAYHSRWAVPDMVMTQFTVLAVFCFLRAVQKLSPVTGRKWLASGAAISGLACGTKYQAVFLLLPMTLVVSYRSHFSWRSWLKAAVIFVLAYFVTSPGTLFQFQAFWRDVVIQQRIYSANGHGGYTVDKGWEHFRLMFDYLFYHALSPSPGAAVLFFILACVGIFSVLRDRIRTDWVIFVFPLFYFLILISQRVMIIRNAQVLIPFLAVLSAKGASYLSERFLLPEAAKRIFFLGLTGALLFNACWLGSAAWSVRNRYKNRPDYVYQLSDYIQKHPKGTFLLSQKVESVLKELHEEEAVLLSSQDSEAKAVIVYTSEVKPWEKWLANRSDYTWRVFGPKEVNFNYYPSWAGEERIVVIRAKYA